MFYRTADHATDDRASISGHDPGIAAALTSCPARDEDMGAAMGEGQGLPGRLAAVGMDGELPRREDLPLIFDELDHQMAVQAYLWSLPLVSYAQWQAQHREVFGATDYDLVRYLSYCDRLG
jgi:hypothetical protein